MKRSYLKAIYEIEKLYIQWNIQGCYKNNVFVIKFKPKEMYFQYLICWKTVRFVWLCHLTIEQGQCNQCQTHGVSIESQVVLSNCTFVNFLVLVTSQFVTLQVWEFLDYFYFFFFYFFFFNFFYLFYFFLPFYFFLLQWFDLGDLEFGNILFTAFGP